MERLTYFKDGYWRVNFSGVQYQADFVDRLAAYEDMAELCGGLDRLRELAEADKDGRCVVLPCKVGDTVYFACARPVLQYKVTGYKIEKASISRVLSKHVDEETGMTFDFAFRPSRIGKTVFFTREEAERALEGRKNG